VTERNSADAERDSKDVKLFAFLKAQLQSGQPERYPALVTDVRNFGFFVDVPGLAMSGLVPLSTMEDDFYVFDAARNNLVGRRTRRVIRLGDKLTVQVAKVDSFKKQVDFRLAHDSYWQEATVEFSDGSTEKLALKQVATGQEFPLAKRTVSWLVLKNLKPAADKWCALCEFEAWGRDAAEFAYVPDAAFAAQLRQDPLVAKAMAAMMGFQRASWEQGVAGQALLEAGERDAAIALARASLIYVNQNGVVAALNGSTTDPLMLGDCLWWSARQTGDAELVKAADNMLQFALQGAPRAADGTPFHQASSQEMWADGSFTTPPFLAAAGRPDEAVAQLLGVHRRLWDADKKLMHHRWSEKKQALVGPAFWGGGNGWTAAAFARVIRSLPARPHSRARTTGRHAQGIARWLPGAPATRRIILQRRGQSVLVR
jgi:predicted RNA-binding protein with RPS1 domain